MEENLSFESLTFAEPESQLPRRDYSPPDRRGAGGARDSHGYVAKGTSAAGDGMEWRSRSYQPRSAFESRDHVETRHFYGNDGRRSSYSEGYNFVGRRDQRGRHGPSSGPSGGGQAVYRAKAPQYQYQRRDERNDSRDKAGRDAAIERSPRQRPRDLEERAPAGDGATQDTAGAAQDNAGDASDKSPVVIMSKGEGAGEISATHTLLFGRIFDQDLWSKVLVVAKECGTVQQVSHKEKQTFGFVDFAESNVLETVEQKLGAAGLSSIEVLPVSCVSAGKDPRVSDLRIERNTTLVLKNLAFHLKEEHVVELLNTVPYQPLSTSLHCDSVGKFRGMVFVKYRSIDEAETAFEMLNGKDVVGRKLKVEYKKKVKAAPSELSQSLGGQSHTTAHRDHDRDIDLNDEETLAFYNQLLFFKQNAMSSSLVLSSKLTERQRWTIHILADRIGSLNHDSVGEGDKRHIVLTRKGDAPFAFASSGGSPRLGPNGSNGRRDRDSPSADDSSRGIEIKQRRGPGAGASGGSPYGSSTDGKSGSSWTRGSSYREQMAMQSQPVRQPRGPPQPMAKGFAGGGRGRRE